MTPTQTSILIFLSYDKQKNLTFILSQSYY